ncbi:hypothetical protein Tco_0749673 [Tanacetum coccineum]|uniref:Uncharacterized protein n=1 Tax=Tanacetum coccineum TaxID=301880 RepID=A0ABQ4YZX9_9ASTR
MLISFGKTLRSKSIAERTKFIMMHSVESMLIGSRGTPKHEEFPKKDKITKADLEGPTFELLKSKFKNNIELEYNMEQCYLAMTGRISWANSEGNRFHTYISKSLPLEGSPGRKTIPTRYFFNNDLEYLKHGNQEKKYALSVTKIKAARYEQDGIEEMIPYL